MKELQEKLILQEDENNLYDLIKDCYDVCCGKELEHKYPSVDDVWYDLENNYMDYEVVENLFKLDTPEGSSKLYKIIEDVLYSFDVPFYTYDANDELVCVNCNESLKEDVDSLTLSGEEEIPEIESQDVVTVEEPSQEDVDNGMYNIISQEMRDTLQDIENLKSIITTLKANDESREDIVEGLETIIDERAIHVGMLQSMLDSFDEGTKQLIDQGRLTLEEPELVDVAKEEVVDSNVDKLV